MSYINHLTVSERKMLNNLYYSLQIRCQKQIDNICDDNSIPNEVAIPTLNKLYDLRQIYQSHSYYVPETDEVRNERLAHEYFVKITA